MSKIVSNVARFFFYGVFLVVFVMLFANLFLGADFNSFTVNKDAGLHAYDENYDKNLKIVFPNEPTGLEPTLIDVITRQRLVDTYETLVAPDNNMELKPSLALSWGMIDSNTWEFRLRPNVVFHDGTAFDSEDAKVSIERAMTYEKSELKNFLVDITDIKILDPLNLRIVTKNPDPLLLQKISMVFMIPAEYKDKEIEIPVGTGVYKIVSWKKGTQMTFERFSRYWGDEATFPAVDVYFSPDKSERVQMLVDGKADFLANVPYEAVDILKNKDFDIERIPSLEVQFIVFNMKSEFMSVLDNRKAVSLLIDQNDLIRKVGGFARTASQFVSNGIFGFNTEIPAHEYDLVKAETLAGVALSDKTLQIHLLGGLDVLGEYLRQQLNKLSIHAVVSYLSPEDLMQSMSEGKADIYFLAMKSDLGDASSFFNDIASTTGSFNIGRYSNTQVDGLTDSASAEMDAKSRLMMLKEAMQIVVQNDPIGVPLFEYETIYAFRKNIYMEPRIDGFVHFDNLKIKK